MTDPIYKNIYYHALANIASFPLQKGRGGGVGGRTGGEGEKNTTQVLEATLMYNRQALLSRKHGNHANMVPVIIIERNMQKLICQRPHPPSYPPYLSLE